MVGMPGASDAQIVERLTALGMEAWLAEHLVQWLPLAAILQRSKTVQFETAFTVAGTSSSFDDAPIFLTARAVLSRRSQANIAKKCVSMASSGRAAWRCCARMRGRMWRCPGACASSR